MKDYYLLIGLNSKDIKIININQKNGGLIEVEVEGRRKKVKFPECRLEVFI